MAEFDYEVVNGRKIRVRPVETIRRRKESGRSGQIQAGVGKTLPLV